MPKIIASAAALLITFIFAPSMAFANHGSVLGSRSTSQRVDLAVNQGPGALLPSSPLYFMDLLRDNVTLFLTSFDGAAKARLHLALAGERISEINMMLDTGVSNPRAYDYALSNMSENVESASRELKLSKNKGNNVEILAADLNTVLNDQKQALSALRGKTDEEGSLKIAAKLAKIREIEITVEHEMAPDQLANELVFELELAYKDAAAQASQAATVANVLEEELSDLKPIASESSPTVAGAHEEATVAPPPQD